MSENIQAIGDALQELYFQLYLGLEDLLGPIGTAPGIYLNIEGIPTAITSQHNQSFYYWQKAHLKNAVLLTTDAHADMIAGAPFEEELSDGYYDCLGVSNFFCPAIHYEIFSSIYWLNPHSDKKRLQYLGSTSEDNDKLKIQTGVHDGRIKWYMQSESRWSCEGLDEGRVITPTEISLEGRPLVLDIDLDAFCCHVSVRNVHSDYKGVSRYQQRILQTIEVLEDLKRPDLITITRSQRSVVCVPRLKVGFVQYHLIKSLRELYDGGWVERV